jgi:hypothetical protein
MILPAEELAQIGIVTQELPSVRTRNVVSSSDVFLAVYGPLHDRRVVRGKSVCICFRDISSSNGLGVYKAVCGFSSGDMSSTNVLTNNGGSLLYTYVDVPDNAEGFYFYISASDGSTFTDDSDPYSLKVYDSIVSLCYYDSTLVVNYSGSAIGENEVLHFGYNNWQGVSETNMTRYTEARPQYFSTGGYCSVSFSIPDTANYIDFVVRGNGIWDNNSGADWHFSLRPLVDAQVVFHRVRNKQVGIYYSNGKLWPVTAHYGYDGWQGIKDTLMIHTYSCQWTFTVPVPETATEFDTCFRCVNTWENNYNLDWSSIFNRTTYSSEEIALPAEGDYSILRYIPGLLSIGRIS